MILPSFQCATVTIVLLKDSPVDRSVRAELPVIAVQFPAAILIGWAIIVLGVDDSDSFAHWTCWSIPLVILPEKSTPRTIHQDYVSLEKVSNFDYSMHQSPVDRTDQGWLLLLGCPQPLLLHHQMFDCMIERKNR